MEPTSMRRLPFLLLTGALLAGCRGGDASDRRSRTGDLVHPGPISADLHMELETWFSQNGLPPREYVLGLFAKHDVVLLGEQHRIRHDVLFIQELLPHLHEAGVSTFGGIQAVRNVSVEHPILSAIERTDVDY